MTSFGADNSTSYFSAPSTELDPKLFQGRVLRDWVRKGVTHLLQDFLQRYYRHSELWTHAWLAGSAVSYQWSADREPGDLDCLIGVDFVQFRQANPEYRGLTDPEISATLNEKFKTELNEQTSNWNGFELTFYVNPEGTDIRNIKPYAAYDLKYDEWTVTPNPTQTFPKNAEWESVTGGDYQMSKQISARFTAALQDSRSARSAAVRRNAEVRLNSAAQQADSLYDEIHGNRSLAFSPAGEGYGDFHNYRWQAGKRLGTIDALRSVRDVSKQINAEAQANLYGVELPDASTLIRRAALHRNI